MRFDTVIFDIDNVLVDTRASYTDCIRKTVEIYLETILGFHTARTPLLSRKDVELFKSLGGFNDDWDTCYGLLLYCSSLKPKRRTLNELRKKIDLTGFMKNIKTSPLGVKGVEKLLRSKISVPISLKKISDLFQRFYLGEYVWNEKLLLSGSFLKKIRRSGIKTAIVTGRNLEEARFALRRFQIETLIDKMITQDETPKHLKKPDPYGLVKIAKSLGQGFKYLYIGDLPDDVIAAKRAKQTIRISSCGYLAAAGNCNQMRVKLKKAGADYICKTPKELLKIILPKYR